MNGIEITAVGNLTKDIELRYSSSGKAWATFSIAVNEISTVNNERRENVTYLDCKIFGEQAEYLVESAGKGNRVIIIGKMRDEKWNDQAGNERRSKVLYVDEVGVSVRWATAQLTKKVGSGNNTQPSQSVTNNASGFASEQSSEENPFI